MSLKNEINELESFIKSVNDTLYKAKLMQLVLFCKGLIKYESSQYEKSYLLFLGAIKEMIPQYEIVNYHNYIYTSFEIQILMNIAIIMLERGETGKYVELLEFCKKNLNERDPLYPRICNSLGIAYNRIGRLRHSIKVYDEGIYASKKYSNLNDLDLLYYGKGSAEYKLGHENCIDFFKLSLDFCDLTGRKNVRDIIIRNLKKFYNLEFQ